MVAFVGGCTRDAPPPHTTALSAAPRRIVSLSPAVTQIIADLGLGDQIVAVHQNDTFGSGRVESVGDNTAIDYERLVSLRPTDVFVQRLVGGMPPKLTQLADQFGWRVHTFAIDTLDDVRKAVHGSADSSGSIGAALGVEAQAERLLRRVQRQMEAIEQATSRLDRPDVLLVVYTAPLNAAGPGTFLDTVLAAAGGRNVIDSNAAGLYPTLDRERLLALRPDVIIVFDPSPAGDGVPPLQLPQGFEARIEVLRDPLCLLPSTNIPATTAALARLLHPSLGETMDGIMLAEGAE